MKKLQWTRRFGVGLFLLGAAVTAAAEEQTPPKADTKPNSPSKFRSAEDGMPDWSGFLDEAYGFIPLIVPITEPAVGFGGAAALIFIDKPKEQKEAKAGFGRPNITAVGGMRTENGTKGAFAGDGRYWLDDRLQTLVGFLSASINLEFSGIGSDSLDTGDPKTYNLDTNVGIAQAKYRLGNSKSWVGLRYAVGDTTVKFDALPAQPLPDFEKNTRVAGLVPSYTYDSRDSIFTPSHGSYLEITPGIFREALGSDVDFERSSVVGMYYLPLAPEWTLGLRGDATFSSGDVPFYLRPFIMMRGVTAMSQQGEYVAQTEAELRWQFWGRFSLVGFGGAGVAWNNFEHLDNKRNVTAGGVGFRYELARKYGLHVGLDVAGGPDGPAYYIQFGSAWMRP